MIFKMADEMKRNAEDLQGLSKENLIKMVMQLRQENRLLQGKVSSVSSPSECQSTAAKEENNSRRSAPNKTVVVVQNEIESPSPKTSKQKNRKRKAFDFSRYNSRRIALKIAYLGWDMHGFASQENIDSTIEAHLFEALTKACLVEGREGCFYSRCGRTDKGVSAFGQVISLHIRTNLAEGFGVIQREGVDNKQTADSNTSEIPYVEILNKLLPNEIRVLAWTPAGPEFDARFSCSYRKYKYYFPMGDLNIDLMNEAAKRLQGEHDFRNFCKMDVANGVVQFKRSVTSFEVRKLGMAKYPQDGVVPTVVGPDESNETWGFEMCEAIICGTAFLWHQVRCMMSAILMVGQGLEKPEIIDWMLNTKECPRRPQYNMSCEYPLVLYDCGYEDLEWIYSSSVLESVTKHLQQLWSTYATRATLARELITTLDSAMTPGGGPWGDCKPLMLYQSSGIVPGLVAKSHKKLMKRAVCESLEEKLENVNNKRRRLGKEPFVVASE